MVRQGLEKERERVGREQKEGDKGRRGTCVRVPDVEAERRNKCKRRKGGNEDNVGS